jgi:(1->4)-alpha-D-glucan 1-alpha-D-glucosylmutase
VNTSWIQPNEAWEAAVRGFVADIIGAKPARFLKSFVPVAEQIAQLGMVNSLSQLVLKMTVPGVPDVYQGMERWSFTLVDPDNRVPVDYEAVQRAMQSSLETPLAVLMEQWRDGRIKHFVTRKLARFRREHPALFQTGEFIRLRTRGPLGDCCFAFLRRLGNDSLLVVVPRLTQRVGFPPVGERWADTAVELPGEWRGQAARDLFTGSRVQVQAPDDTLSVSALLRELPVAVCHLAASVAID